MVACEIVFLRVISEVEVIRLSGIFCGERVDLFNKGDNIETASNHPDFLFIDLLQRGDLFIRESGPLCFGEQLAATRPRAVRESLLDFDNILHPVEEPLIDCGQRMDLFNGEALAQGLRYRKDPFVSRFLQFLLEIIEVEAVVTYEAGHTDIQHSQSLLDRLLKSPTDGHNFAN